MQDDTLGTIADNSDLWSLILSFLPLPLAILAAKTCRLHLRESLLTSRQACRLVSFHLHARHVHSLEPLNMPPALWLEETNERGSMKSAVRLLPPLLRSKPPLPTIINMLSRLGMLHLYLDPRPGAPAGPVFGQESLYSMLGWLDPSGGAMEPLKDGESGATAYGCLPWVLVQCPFITEIEMATNTVLEQEELEMSVPRLESLMLTLLLSTWRRLVRLNIRGIAPFVLDSLLGVELPSLLILQCGDCSTHAAANRADFYWPDSLLPRVGHAFPSLIGLDVGYMLTTQGVSYPDVYLLTASCAGLQHLVSACWRMPRLTYPPCPTRGARPSLHRTCRK